MTSPRDALCVGSEKDIPIRYKVAKQNDKRDIERGQEEQELNEGFPKRRNFRSAGQVID